MTDTKSTMSADTLTKYAQIKKDSQEIEDDIQRIRFVKDKLDEFTREQLYIIATDLINK